MMKSLSFRLLAVVGVLLGSGGLLTASAADISVGSVFVPITPVRVLDTRIGAGLADALVSDVPATLPVTGAIATVRPGDVIVTGSPVPMGATGVVTNTTVVGPSTIGYLAVRPGNATGEPATSSINFTSPGAIVPNAVTTELPTGGAGTGAIQLWFHGTSDTATTHVLVDIVGYYQPAPTGTTPGPPGSVGATGPGGPTGPQGPTGRVRIAGVNIVRGLLPAGSTVIDGAVNSTDQPVVIYRVNGGVSDQIKVLTCVDPVCANTPVQATMLTFPSGLLSGFSATVGPDDVPRVAYVSGNNLRVVTCLDAACTGTPSNNVAATSPPTGWTMSSPSIAALPNGNAVVSVAVNGDPFETAPAPFGRITLVNCANFSCAGPSTVTAVHNLSEISTTNGSLVIAPDGFPWLTLARDSDQLQSILIDCKDTFCSQRDVSIIVVASALRMPQMSIGFDGTPLLSFWSLASSVGDGNAIWFHGPRLQGDWVTGDSVAHTTTVDGRPIIFYENNGAMYSATCGDFDCTVFDPPVQVAAAGTVWPFRGPNGYPLLIHAGASGASVIECGSASCAS